MHVLEHSLTTIWNLGINRAICFLFLYWYEGFSCFSSFG